VRSEKWEVGSGRSDEKRRREEERRKGGRETRPPFERSEMDWRSEWDQAVRTSSTLTRRPSRSKRTVPAMTAKMV
jgi:hypothetical protein